MTEAGEEGRAEPGVKGHIYKARGEIVPSKSASPRQSTNFLEVQKSGPMRVLNRRRVPTKRNGINVMKVDNVREEYELKPVH